MDTLQTDYINPGTPIEKEIAELNPWFHNIHLPGGEQTAPNHPLGDFPMFKWMRISPHIPRDLSGWTVLDVGCNAGFYSIEMAKRGARVTAVDMDDHYLKQAEWAAEKFKVRDKITLKKSHVYNLGIIEDSYDIVLFLGVFYHLRYPLLALDILAKKVEKYLVFQTLTMPGEKEFKAPPDLKLTDRKIMMHPGWPKMAFIERKLEGDPTNWWAPNGAAVEAMLRSAGLIVEKRPAHEIYICGVNEDARIKQIQEAELSAAIQSLKEYNFIDTAQ